MRFACYGLVFESEIDLPELGSPLPPALAAPADVRIQLGGVAESGEAYGKQLGPFLWASDDALWLQVPEVARFLVEQGQHITIEPAPGIDIDSVRLFLLGSAFGALLTQRGLMVLHGNAIRIGDQCMICVGPSGAGKSTTAAGLLRRGYPILADDVVPIDALGRAWPGFPRIKLWQDTASRLAVDTAALRRVRPALEKFHLPLTGAAQTEPLPVRWIYALDSRPEAGVIIETVRGIAAFNLLQNNLYRVRYLQGMKRHAEHLNVIGLLGRKARIARLVRPDRGFELEAVLDCLLADAAEHP